MTGQSLFDLLSNNTQKSTKEGKGKMKTNTRRFGLALSALTLVALLLSVFGAVPMQAGTGTTETISLGGYYATDSDAAATSETYQMGEGSWKATPGVDTNSDGSDKFEFYAYWSSGWTHNLGTFTIDDIDSISYYTNKPGAEGDPDFYLTIYTEPDTTDDYGWYGYRLNAEPYFSSSLNAPANQWNEWNTDTGTNQLTFCDHWKSGTAGFYGEPTLQTIQAGVINWQTDYGYGVNQDIDYGTETVKGISFSTGSGWSGTFDGYIDAVTIVLKDGTTLTVDFENEVWVDDGYDSSTSGWGKDHFNSIQDGVDAVADGGTVNVAAGTYDSSSETFPIVINKSLTLLGAQANVDPRPSQGGRTGSESVIDADETSSAVIQISASDVEINGFTITGGTGDMVEESGSADNLLFRYNILYDDLATCTPGDEGIQIKYSDGVVMEYNYAYDICQDAFNLSSSSNGVVRYNEAHDIYSENAAIYCYDDTNVDVIGNLVYDVPDNDGIKVGDTPGELNVGGIVKGNVVHDIAEDGITIYATDQTVESNIIYNCGSENGALYLWGADDTIVTKNKIYNNDAIGLLIVNSDNVSVTHNDIYNNNDWDDTKYTGSAGIWLTSDTSNITINYNSITGNADFGVKNEATTVADAENNWWGSGYGPLHDASSTECLCPGEGGWNCDTCDENIEPGGQLGDSVSDHVDYCPWLGSSPLESVWNRYAGNPVVTGSAALDPVVVKDGSTYRMWYAHRDGAGTWSIYYADSPDGTTWTHQTQVLTGGGSGAWDEELREGPAVIKDDSNCQVAGCQWKMWYTGRNSAGVNQIGYAETSDAEGDTGWTRYGSDPVLKPGTLSTDWDNQLVREPWVIKDGSTYKMWYSGTQQWPYFRIGYVESTDGVTWTTSHQQVTGLGGTAAWDEAQQYAPSVVKIGSTYYLYYSGTDGGPGRPSSYRWSTGTAMSSDGKAWTKDSRNPILIPAPTEPDSLDFVSAMYDGGWKVWFSYVPSGEYAIGLATLGAPTMELYLDPVSQGVLRDGSSTVTYDIRLANASGVYGYNFELTFDATYVQATSAVTVTTFFDCQATTPDWNGAIDNGAGTVRFACSRTAPQNPVYGSGPLAQVTFEAKAGGSLGTSVLDFSSDTQKLKLVDRDGFRLTTETQHGFIRTWGAGSLSGSVTLQGRTNHSGATVTIQNDSGYVDTTTTNAAGAWSFTAVPADTNYQVNVDMNRYLDAQKGDLNTYTNLVTVSDEGSTALSNVKLLGGDIVAPPEDGDDIVDISDIAVIGSAYAPLTVIDPALEKADINYDTYVDISDFVIAAGNYNSSSPVTWP